MAEADENLPAAARAWRQYWQRPRRTGPSTRFRVAERDPWHAHELPPVTVNVFRRII